MAAPKIKQNSDGSVVRRVSPYPITVQIMKSEGQPVLTAQIVKLTEIGFLMKADTTYFYKVSENYQFHFQLPVIEKVIYTTGIVVKTYDAMESSSKSPTKMQTIEVHFKDLSSKDRGNLNTYLVKSGQRK